MFRLMVPCECLEYTHWESHQPATGTTGVRSCLQTAVQPQQRHGALGERFEEVTRCRNTSSDSWLVHSLSVHMTRERRRGSYT